MEEYFLKYILGIKNRLSDDMNSKSIDKVINKDLHFHLSDRNSKRFQSYYFKILCNKEFFLNENNFFLEFKRQYGLQGIDNNFLNNKLENNKMTILTLINEEKLADLYFGYFACALIKFGNTTKPRDLSSFFTKLVHTFEPGEYCALDNPIKNLLGLQRESFYIAFKLISTAYKEWAADNQKTLISIREGFKNIDREHIMYHDKITDLKLIDLIYWTKAKNGKSI